MIEVRPGEGFAVERNDGVVWLEAPLGGARFRFPLARDEQGEVLDLGVRSGIPSDHVQSAIENRIRVCEAMGLDPGEIFVSRQVHGAELVDPATDGDAVGRFSSVEIPRSSADGLLLSEAGAAVTVADCMAIGLAGERGIAIVHCGWRGLAAGILESAATRTGPGVAVIGPAVGGCCYEVGPEVAAALEVKRSSTGTVDLAGIARGRLAALGFESVKASCICTSCGPGDWFSHRRQGAASGRHAAIVTTT